ncbi:copper-translocating P-type ATPase [Rhodococcus sp. ACPA4]|uniref:heavy metal translocating P-type ATPase n=1 Tax=Rhodococcus sp. ACPA4 TaxID=2028571 RepID=UPI000BB1454C|nr:heavy metal translocating P-type ATPase [Rhodococcus sp. ACPA4]PBC37459.1 copper-translocating P-type ATPase [Rhodococcus sp. ACPA4]
MDHSDMDHSDMDHGHANHGHANHGGHGDHVAQFRKLFVIMFVIAFPVVAADAMFADLVGYTLPDNTVVTWTSPILGTVMYFWGGKPFLVGGLSEFRARQPGMMLLIALAITVAFFASWAASLHWVDHTLDFWWELALLIVIMLLGHWIEMRSLSQTSSALDSLAAMLPDEAERLVGDEVEMVPTSLLATGDLVMVRPGARVPSDGAVVEGSADMDESMITGESKTVRRTIGDQVVAGTVATDSALRVRVTAVGEDTALAGIRRLVEQAQNSSSRAQMVADKAAALLFWYALGAAVLTAAAWTVWGTPEEAVTRTITVLVIACPHALGLAIPLVVSIATERAARAGILITDRMALENMRKVDTVLFDKTGTLTKGEPAVVGVRAADGYTEDQVLRDAASVEFDSEHPLGRAIVAAARERNLVLASGSNFQAHNGIGVVANVDGASIGVGGPGMLKAAGNEVISGSDDWLSEGWTVLHVSRDDVVMGALALADEIRPESKPAVDALHARGVGVAMVTGDASAVAHSVAGALGIDAVFAEVLPQDKGAEVSKLQAARRRVAMVGDGVNDAPALAKADVGIAIGAGTDVAIASAGVVLASDDPRAVASVIELSHATYRKMVQNLWWAAGYNAISVPLAAGVLAPVGFVLPMEVGAILMSVSTVVVAVNAQLLRRLDLRQPPVPAGQSKVLTPQL